MTDVQLVYHQASGLIATPEGQFVSIGWSGHGIGKNDPEFQSEKSFGPLPQGVYRVGAWEEQHPGLGPMVAHLEQIEGNNYGRDGFYFHGPAQDPSHYGNESKGCIVVPRPGREKVREAAPEGSKVQVVA